MIKKKYKFSIVIPIYNVEEYLRETIESVVKQTIGFEENVQLILINDGSPDNSSKICEEYSKKYPENIKYIEQENGGVSSARNNGMKYVEGEYVNFLDSDDLWQEDALEKVYSFFKLYEDEIDVTSHPLEYFDGKKGMKHPLNWKYDSDRVVDLTEEPSYVQMSNSSCFIKSDAIDEKFDTNLKYGEDSLFINKIILKKMKIGLISSVHYMYRKRTDGSSAMDKNINTPEYYINTIKYFHQNLIDYAKEISPSNKIPMYIQYVIMYDLQWRINARMPKTAISSSELKEYRSLIIKLLKEIDIEVILNQRNMSKENKLFALRLKNAKIIDKIIYKDGIFFYNNEEIYSIQNNSMLNISLINVRNNKLQVSAKFNCPLEEKNIELYYVFNGKKQKVIFDEQFDVDNKYVLDEKVYKIKYFNIKEKINTKNENSLTFYLKYKDEEPIELFLNFSVNGKLTRGLSMHYVKNDIMVIQKSETIVAKPYKRLEAIFLELKLLVQLLFKGAIKQTIYRTLCNIARLTKKKELWLISDRISIANDNGMHLFKYISEKKLDDKDIYFVIKNDCEDYEKMKQFGKVLPYDSFKYKLKFLLADKIISSQADEFLTNAFGKKNRFYRDLYRFDFVFLQHGIIKDDLSTWLNIYNKNIRMFVTSVVGEYDSVVNGKYGFNKDVVKLTGLPRYDNLKDENQKLIAFMPTWRKNIATPPNRETGIRDYSPSFKNSEYFKFYNNLINDKRIINVMKKKGYRGLFVVHPSHVANSVDFQKNDIVDIVDGFADYQEIFKTASLLISDYSSVPFDFAYLYKPVIYTQFDRENFFKSHLYQEGYFKYEKDGLGPVMYDYDDAVNKIVEYINSDCKLEEKYKKRIDKFYKYHDQNNCKRALDEINKL